MEIKDISFSYDNKNPVLRTISSTIHSGKITTIIGPNGSGKSTLLGVMAKSILPDSGQVLLDGKALTTYKAKELARKLAVVHQQNIAPVDLTVEKLTSYGRIPHKTLFSSTTSTDEQAIEWALTCTNLQDKRHKTLDALSGGEKQRVWIAMALAQSTPFLILDEPTTYLDMYYQYEILRLIKDLNEQYGLTVLMVLHDINQAIRYSDYIIAMKNGEIVVHGEPSEVITEQQIKSIYGMDVIVKNDKDTGMYVVPIDAVTTP